MKKTVIILILTLLSVSSVAAQTNSSAEATNPGFVPGDALYPVEKMVESIEVAVARAPVIGSPELEAKVRANNADERLAEARKLSELNRTEKVPELMQEYNRQMEIAVNMSRDINRSEFSRRLKQVNDNHVNILREVEQKVPEEAKKGVRNAIEKSSANSRNLGRQPAHTKGQTGNIPDKAPEVVPGNKDKVGPGNRSLGMEDNELLNETIRNKTEDLEDSLTDDTVSEDENETSENLSQNLEETVNETENLNEESGSIATGEFQKTAPGLN